MKRWMLAAAGLMASTGCDQFVAPADAAEPAAVWMFRNFSWGVQCPDRRAAKPDAPPPALQGAPAARADAGPPPLKQQVDACFGDKISPEAAVECAAKAIANAGIAIREKRTETMSVCEACGCPANALRLHLMVAPTAQSALEAAGFKVRSRPPPPPE
ncbi:MAG TPA: hypothetical protein VGK67_35050 [Myxococcales bacterium]|jgi:hypothetical protein